MNDVRDWLKDIKVRKNEQGRRVLNDSQVRVVECVVERLCAEMLALANDNFDNIGEPLRWSMHGAQVQEKRKSSE